VTFGWSPRQIRRSAKKRQLGSSKCVMAAQRRRRPPPRLRQSSPLTSSAARARASARAVPCHARWRSTSYASTAPSRCQSSGNARSGHVWRPGSGQSSLSRSWARQSSHMRSPGHELWSSLLIGFADFLMRFAVVCSPEYRVFYSEPVYLYILTLEKLQIKPKTSIRHKVTPEICVQVRFHR